MFHFAIQSTGTTWALYALTQSPKVQRKLREELLKVDTDNPTMDQLNSLPYLDMVVRETLRVHAPVPSTMRVAMKDDVLPLSKPFTDRKGNVHEGIRCVAFGSEGRLVRVDLSFWWVVMQSEQRSDADHSDPGFESR